MPGFVDIHSHILHGLDDGARTLEQSVEMLTLARDAGTTDIVATPHANGQYAFRPDRIEARVRELAARVPGITIHRGCDFHLQVDNIEDAIEHPEKYTVNHRGYLLVEFPNLAIFPAGDDILEKLIGAGMTPIITHPERSEYLQRSPDVLARWIESGCYAQVTAASFTGLFGRQVRSAANDLMKRDLVHFVASDAHDMKHRPPDLREAYALLARDWGEERIGPLFTDNPRAVLEGEEIDVIASRPAPKRRAWWRFW